MKKALALGIAGVVLGLLAPAAGTAAQPEGRPQAPAVVQSYTGCLNPGPNTLVQVAVGDIPANPPCRSGAVEVHFSGGDLTSLTAGTGLTGGGANGDVSVALAPTFQLPQTCTTNQAAAWNGSGWGCLLFTPQSAFDSLVALLGTPGTINLGSNPVHWTKLKGVPAGLADGTDDVGPSYSAGFGLNLSGTTFSVDSAQVQRRVSETCAAGSAIRAVQEDGTVTCETVSSGGGARWSLTGNAGTDDTNYLGTSDDRPLNLRVNGQRALRLEPRAQSPNVIGGHGDNSAASGVAGATIGGGGSSSGPNSVLGDFGTVGGGEGNEATGPAAFVGGGFTNRAQGQRAVVPGGSFNEAIGDWSFAAGFGAHADDFGSFVWSSGGAATHSTGMNQFVVRAPGGLHLLDGQLFCDGCVTRRDIDPKAMPGIAGYCALAQANPRSFPDAPCRARPTTVDPAAGFVGYYTSLAIGLDGNPVISYWDATNRDLKVAHCNDPTCIGADEDLSTVDSAGLVGRWTSLAIGADGNPVISYLDESNENLKVARCNDLACAGTDETLSTVDSAGIVGAYNSIEVGGDGNPVISYLDATNGNLKVARCNDPACAGADETLSTVDSGGGVSSTSLAIGTDGNPVVAYFDGMDTSLKVAHCNDPACAGADEALSTVDSAGWVGADASVAVGTDGNPVISYFDNTNFDLKVAHCNELACAGTDETLSTVDSAGSVGFYTSLAIGTDGNPVISYYDDTNSNLKVAHCNDFACTGANETLSTVDSAGGNHTSLAIGTDGVAVVSYHDVTNDNLKVARTSVSGN